MRFSTPLILAAIPSLAIAHGIITTPPPRAIGPASLAACGPAITNIIKADNQSGAEVLHAASATDPLFNASSCNLRVCKGLQFADNLDNVQDWSPGEVVNLKVWTRIPHKGWVNVAIVDSETLFLVGEPLSSFETDSVSGYDVGTEVAPVDMDFNITVPEDLGGRCEVAGDCVLQWTWFGRVVKQTYESCIDFTVKGQKSRVQAQTSDAQEKFVQQILH